MSTRRFFLRFLGLFRFLGTGILQTPLSSLLAVPLTVLLGRNDDLIVCGSFFPLFFFGCGMLFFLRVFSSKGQRHVFFLKSFLVFFFVEGVILGHSLAIANKIDSPPLPIAGEYGISSPGEVSPTPPTHPSFDSL